MTACGGVSWWKRSEAITTLQKSWMEEACGCVGAHCVLFSYHDSLTQFFFSQLLDFHKKSARWLNDKYLQTLCRTNLSSIRVYFLLLKVKRKNTHIYNTHIYIYTHIINKLIIKSNLFLEQTKHEGMCCCCFWSSQVNLRCPTQPQVSSVHCCVNCGWLLIFFLTTWHSHIPVHIFTIFDLYLQLIITAADSGFLVWSVMVFSSRFSRLSRLITAQTAQSLFVPVRFHAEGCSLWPWEAVTFGVSALLEEQMSLRAKKWVCRSAGVDELWVAANEYTAV